MRTTARLYLVASSRIGSRPTADLLPELLEAGVDLFQLREKETEAADLLRLGEPLVEICRDAGVPFVLNDRADVALALRADGVHLGQNDVDVATARAILGPQALVGRSTHTEREVGAEAADAEVDYIAVGPVYATPTKPGRPAAGIGLVAHAADVVTETPWFAIGGINRGNLDRVIAAGARRIVVVRAITEAPDPPGAAAELRGLLDAAD